MGSIQQHVASVLIVGGGLSGLTAAVALAKYGIPTMLIERRSGHLDHPRADGFTPTTVEIFRSLGFGADSIQEKSPDFKLRRVRVHSLTGEWLEEQAWNPQQREQEQQKEADQPAAKELQHSPYRGATTPQDKLEPVLAARTVQLGVDVRFHHEFVKLQQDGEHVICTIRNRDTDALYDVSVRYLVAADGHRSPIREALGIARSGHGTVGSVKSVLFRAPNFDAYLKKGATQFTIDQPNLKAFLIAYQDGRLVLHLPNTREYSDEDIQTLTRQAIGTTDHEAVHIAETRQWDMAALISDRFAAGRVFLIGDAAHSLPPNRGGYGANTGIADAYNLAWKLARVLHGRSEPALLETYEAERLPVAWLRHDQIFARTDFKTLKNKSDGDDGAATEALDDAAMEFGQLYRSAAICGDEGADAATLPAALSPDKWAGQPGTRAPHVVLEHKGQPASTLDLFGEQFVLISRNPSWEKTLAGIQGQASDTKFVHVSEDVQTDGTPSFSDAFGVSDEGCSLVRPDGYIAWRSVAIPENPAGALESALRTASVAAK